MVHSEWKTNKQKKSHAGVQSSLKHTQNRWSDTIRQMQTPVFSLSIVAAFAIRSGLFFPSLLKCQDTFYCLYKRKGFGKAINS